MTSTQSPKPSDASFAETLAAQQSRLYAFVYSQLGDPELARDVLQETNRVLWENAAEFDASRPFLPWAFGVAKNQVRAARQRIGRERLCFDPDVAEALADRLETHSLEVDRRQAALADCLDRLPLRQREVVQRRYGLSESLAEIAQALGRSASAVGVMLFRCRQSLAECIQTRLEGAEV